MNDHIRIAILRWRLVASICGVTALLWIVGAATPVSTAALGAWASVTGAEDALLRAPAVESEAPVAEMSTVAPPSAAPTAVRFVALDSCGGGQNLWQFAINGVAVPGAFPVSSTCICEEKPHTVATVTDPAVLAAVSEPACNTVTAKQVGGGMYVVFVRAEIVRPAGVETLCAVDYTGLGCQDRVWACNGYAYGGTRTWGPTALPDNDGDGLVSCNVDNDDDNDGVLDANDNCTLTANPTQVDTDSNGAGDACDPVDRDSDGLWNINDNCPDTANADQLDTDGNGTGDACQAAVVAVPWAGSEAKPHVVYSGGSLVLQASATKGGRGEPVSLASGSWDPGDGSGPQAIDVSNSRVLELTRTYTAADYTPFTATVSVTDTNGNSYTDTFKVQVVPRTLEAEVNMAIDKGLWAQHKAMVLSTDSGQTLGNWTDGDHMAATSATIQGFQVNGHRQTGDPLKDPYADDVARGLRYLQKKIRRISINAQAGGNPDVNGNGYGLETDHHEPVYVVGQVVDAFVASGTPNAQATIGSEVGRAYRDIVQDLLDAYAWGQHENNQGGWVYQWNSQHGIDSSSSAWWGVAQLAAEVFGVSSPNWVKQLNQTYGVPSLQNYSLNNYQAGQGNHGACSYRENGGDASPTRTAACMIMMSADGMSRSSSRFAAAEGYLARNFNGGELHGNMYAMYNLAKSMRTAKDNSGSPSPIVLMGGTIDWYNADPFPGSPTDGRNGLARYLVGRQAANGAWTSDGWVNGSLSSAYAILILSPALFEQAPTAVCSVDATVVCQAGAVGGCNASNGNLYSTVNFDASLSTPGDNAIASYAWNFQDGSPSDASIAPSHSFSTTGTFGVRLTVTDTKGNSSAVVCPVRVTAGALPPVADPGGPYDVCPNRAPSVILDATGSIGRGSQIAGYQWDWTLPINFASVDSTAAVTNQTAHFASLAPGTYDVGLRVTDDTPPADGPFSDTRYTTVTVRTANDPRCNAAPLATDNSYTIAKNNAASGNVSIDGTADSDADGDSFAASVVTGPAQGTLSLNSDGTFTYTPPTGFDGTVTFTYKQTDQFGAASSPATVTIVVLPNVDPVAIGDAAPTLSGTPVTVAVLSNDSDGDVGQTLTVTGTSAGPANGNVVVNGGGTVTYTPNLGFAGTDVFTYSISDGNGGTASATVTITVTKRPATVTAGSDTKVYGTADPSLTPTSSGFEEGEIVVSATPRETGESVGTYATHATAAGATLANYEVVYNDGSLTITQATAVATATGSTVTYDGAAHAGTCTVAGVNGEVLPGVISYGPSVGAPVNMGTYTVTCDFAGTVNYPATNDTATITINPATLTVTTNSYTRSYLAADPIYAGTLTGAVAGDGITVVYGSTGSGSQVPGSYPIVPTLIDPNGRLANYSVASSGGVLTITNTSPMCTVAPSPALIWPPNHKMVPVTASGATDVDGGPLTYSVVSIFQDEPTNTNGDGNTAIDGAGINTNTAQVRAERTGDPKNPGNGRVYHITFAVTDSLGLSCQSTVTVGVPHDQSGKVQPVDGGAIYNSTVASPPPAATATRGKGN